MAPSRSNKPEKKTTRKDVKFVKGPTTSSKRAPKKAVRGAVSHSDSTPAPKKRKAKQKSASRSERNTIGWNDLVSTNDQKKGGRSEADSFLNTLSTARFAAILLSILTLFTLYVGHVLSTQSLLNTVQTMRRENQTMTLRLNQLRSLEDAVTGPTTIFDRARELGLAERMFEGHPILVSKANLPSNANILKGTSPVAAVQGTAYQSMTKR